MTTLLSQELECLNKLDRDTCYVVQLVKHLSPIIANFDSRLDLILTLEFEFVTKYCIIQHSPLDERR